MEQTLLEGHRQPSLKDGSQQPTGPFTMKHLLKSIRVCEPLNMGLSTVQTPMGLAAFLCLQWKIPG